MAIKFKFDVNLIDEDAIGDVFNKTKCLLKYQLDNDFNAYLVDGNVDYQFRDVSNLNSDDIETITNSFFNFSFEGVSDVCLYKFLVLKDTEKLTVLAIVDSAIFDYSSINDFYGLFNGSNDDSLLGNLEIYYDDIKNYMNSSDFDRDSVYWKNFTLDTSDYVQFYNLKSNDYKSQKIEVNADSVSAFVKSQYCSEFDFYASIFGLYLSRIDRHDGCLLKTGTQLKRSDLKVFNKTILKIDFDKDESFADSLHNFDSNYYDAASHAKVSIENYLSEDLSYYSVYDFSDLKEGICIYNGEDSALTLNVYGDYLDIVYNSDLFSDVYMEHMARNIESLIDNVLDSPDQFIGDIDVLSKEEKDLLTDFCKGESVVVDEDKYLPNAFRENALSYPNAIAVDDGVNKVTFGELEKSSNSIAHDLKENYNIGHGSRVALMLPRTYHFPELVLALNKIGATFIPVDLFYPLKRIEYMLNVSQARYIITTEKIADSFGLKENVICIEDLNDADDVDVDIETRGDELFTIIFTSGTTGLPKGVMVSNSQLPGVGVSFKEIFNYSQGDVIGHYLGFTFVASFVLYAALYFGGCCRIFNEIEQKDSLLLIKALKENHMNSLILPPSIGIPIYENEDLQLDYLVLAGAKLNELSKKEKHTKLVNFYGTTEIICGVTKVYDLKDIEEGNAALGRPVANSWVYILDNNNNQMPIGVPGEICVSNKYISRGYLNNPELTDEVFIDNPHCICEDNKMLYHTGDIGFYNFDGELEIIGREDDQLSVRGFRVESGEILNMMKSFNEISDVYLDVDNDTLIAYYTTTDDLDIEEVKDALNINLPYYMVPSLFIELDEIPLNINGKLDKSLLKTVINNEDIEIADDVIRSVVDAFKEVLNLDFVLIDDDFVALGGNSLSAMKLQLLLKENLGVTLSANELIGLSTPKDIANHIKFNLNVHSTVDEDKYTFEELCPLSESQLNVYLDESVNDMGTAYNNSFKIGFNENYSVGEIKDALVKLFEVFPVLKARVLNDEEGLFFAFDAEPEVVEGSLNDINNFVKQFELDKYLSRFLIVDNDGSIILCADFHHLIFDGTSLNILLKKLSSILNNEKVDYVDKGVLRQIAFEKIIDSNYIDDAKEFYDGMLADRDEVHDLLPSVDDDNESVLIDTFDMDIEYLSSFLQSHSITYNQFFTSVFAYTLSRFSGSEKVLFNIVEDGRGHIDLSESVGMFVKTLPVLMDCKNQHVNSFLEYSSNLVNSVMRYDLYPFRVLASEYDLNSNVVFQYAHNLFSDVVNKGDLKYSVDELKHDLDADFSFYILNNGENSLTIRILYSSLYSRSFIEHFVESYKLILNGIIEADQLEDINYISDSDVKILDEYNQTEHPLIYNDILDAFNDNLLKYPESKLVEYENVSYTYAEGAYLADVIGKKLVDLGINAQDRVSFLVPRSELYMFCVLGVVSIGGVYVPLDDALPNERIEFMMEDTESKVLIVSDETYERGCDLAKDCTILNISEILNGEIKSLDNLDVSYGDLACILYTSGSTGLPKGVKITRKSILNFIDFHVNDLDIVRGDVYGLFASIGFDVAMAAIFSAMYVGGCVNVIPEDIRLNIKALNNHFVEYGVTHSYITTQVAKLFIQEIESSSLKVLIAGGEKLGEINEARHYRIVDAYGPTEACVYVISAATVDKVDSSSVGYVQNNTKAYILDDEFRRVPIGAIGELYLSGCQLADGYLNRPEENAKAFLDNPFEGGPDYGRLYRTGDMARLLPDKTYGIVGRRDNQVKIRGNRVELSEIEVTIREIDYVDDVTVKTIENGSNVELVAYVVADGIDCEVLKENIQDYVREHKPEYMVPSFVIKLDEIPLNVNGKVDKHALPAVDLSSLHVEYVAATNEIEQHIVDAFEVVFNQEGIGLNDDFVRLGGDSITAIRVISLLEKNDISCSARDILNYKTPYLIAQNVQSIESVSYDAVEGAVDLLPIQEFFFDQINMDNFSQHFILKSYEKLDKNVLQEAFNKLCNVHDMLRVRYGIDKNGEAIQEILPVNTKICEINEYYISDDFEESLKEIFIESSNSLNIQNNLIEINLIYHNNVSYVMFIIHHLIIDGVSWNILITDLTNIYTHLKAGKEIELLRPYPYKDWVGDVKDLVSNISPEEKQYWININNLLDESSIKGDSNPFAFRVDVNYDINSLLMLSEEEYWALAIARAYKKTYGKDIIFNRETYGRDESIAKLNRTIGWFTSQYPILVNIDNDYDDVSLMNDVYNIKTAFKDVNNLGLNYYSLIYTTNEFDFKPCPVTFNFLSSEFSFKNELFESYIPELSHDYEAIKQDLESYGITFNVVRNGNLYEISGDYAGGTFIGDEFNEFIENIKSELKFLGDYQFKDNNIVCCLSEAQLGIYLDEKVFEKDVAYSTTGIFEYGHDNSIDEINGAIHALINKHPILKGRVLDTANVPLLVCDSYPSIEIVNNGDYSDLIKPFDLDKSLARFYIMDNEENKFVFYDIHHMISDATSHTIIKNELNQVLMGKLDDAVDLGFVYASMDSFESQYGDKYKSAQEFFQNTFADIGDVQYLLGDVDGKIGSVSLPIRGIRENAELFAQNNGITVGSLLNAVFAYTYSRFTGSDKVYYNFTEHGRHEDYLQDAVGMFVRTIPVIVDCESKSVNDYVANVADLILKSMANSIYPFRLTAREFDLSNDVAFEYNYDLNEFEVGDEIVVRDDADKVSDFLCVVNDLEDGFLVTVSHLDKFSRYTATQFVKVFKEVLTQFLEKENLGDIDYISSEDVELLDSYNKTEHPLVYNDVLDAFNDNLLEHPENKLVSYKDVSYTYAEGAYIADAIGKKLLDLGVGSQDCVSFLVPRSELYMFSILGIMSIGGIYVPLDDALPDERIGFMIRDTNSSMIIVTDETYNRAKELSDGIAILNISDILKGDIGSLSSLPVVYGNIASILYTSGTTGIPKGVKITRKAILNVAAYYTDTFYLDNEDVYGLYASIGFDAGVMSIFKAIYSGACLSVVPEEIRYNMYKLNDYFIEHNVTHTIITTPVGKLFMQTIDDTSLDYLFVGGEKLGEFQSPQNYQLVDEYGPTEGNNFISSINNSDKIDYSSVGKLNYNSKAYILDNEGRRVSCGAVGELYLAGYQIADGYLNREEETNNAFISNSFDKDENYATLYRTGDLVRLLPDGSLGIVGRRDGQVKVRGNRVELSEVESTIRELDYISDVTVQTIKNDDNNELVAYVVASHETEDIKESVCNHVNKYKPDYMVPSFVIQIDSIPLTVNGKVNKRELPDVDLSSLREEYVAPTNDIEKAIVEAFEKVFNDKIGIYDDFLRLGGDSLIGIKLLSYLEGYNINLVDVLSLRTPHAIAEKVAGYEQQFDLDIYSLESGCPLNESQLNIYLDILANDKVDAYLIASYTAISKEYEVDDIIDALNELLNIHPILGMCVNEEFEMPYLVKGSSPEIIVDPNASEDFIIEFLKRPFDLNDCLCRFLIVENGEKYDLIGNFHHLVFDASSHEILKKDLHSILEGKSLDVDDTFLKVSAFAQQISETEEYVEAEKFYNSMLADSDETGSLLGSVLPDGPNIEEFALDLDLELFQSFLDNHGVTPNVLFTSVFSYTLSRFVGSDNVLFNIAENGRERFGNYNAIGMYVNTLPILVDCKNQEISSFMEYMSGLVYDVMKYNYYPFRLLANKYDINSNVIFQFLPEWILNYGYYEKHDIPVLTAENRILYGSRDLITDFIMQVSQKSGGFNLRITYSKKYSSDFVNHFFESYQSILNELINADYLSDIKQITSEEDIKLLNEYNQTEYELVYEDVLDAFNDNLLKYPDSKLVEYENVSYTYGQGAYIADAIGRKLVYLGIDAQDRVSFLVPRSELYMFCVLGVVSIGGVYVPLDDALPNERIEFMMEDTGSKVLIVSDETYERGCDLAKDCTILNISEIINGEIKSLDSLDVRYGDLACILYTSGSTGLPKGVKITRRSILNFIDFHVNDLDIIRGDVYGLFASIGFDVAMAAIFSAMYAGGCVNVIPEDIRLNIKALNNHFVKYGVTHSYITTQVAKLFIQEIESSSLKVLIAGGEKLGEINETRHYRIVDAYGPTEACVYVISAATVDKIDSSSVGYVQNNTKAYILDDEFRRVPIGAIGELYLSGCQLADGYLNRPEENAKAFMDNPFEEDPDYGRLYRTGDMARLLPDKTYGIVGRRDNQVKIRGNRVELSEIEVTIREIDYVDDVTVKTIENGSNVELVAYVVVDGIDEEVLEDDIQSYVREHKPEYMVPSFVIKLDEIPLNVNGKVDKHALPDVDRSSLHAEYVAPRNDNEKEIVEAFEKALNLENVSIYDDFIRLGGDSLTAIRLLSYIDSDDVTMADIFTFRTPEAIAKNMSDLSFDLDLYTLESGCPLNTAQINVFADVTVYNKKNAYHIPGFIPIPKEYGIENIRNSLDKLLNAHPILSMHVIDMYETNDADDVSNLNVLKDLISTAKKFGIGNIMNIIRSYGLNVSGLYHMLRTTIRLFKGEYPYMVKGDKPPISIESDVDEATIIDFFAESLDLYNYLSKFMIVESEESYYLFYLIHHIIFDATSEGVLRHDLNVLLDGGNVDYDDTFLKTSAFTHHIKSTEKFEEASEFYHPILSDAGDVGELVGDNSSEGYTRASYDLEFDKVAFKSFLNKAGITEIVLFSSVFTYALSQFVDGDKVLFTLIENGRDRFNEDFIGMTSNVMPLIADCKDQSINSFMEHMAHLVYGVSRYSYYPVIPLYQDYDFEVKIMFQFVPNWIADDMGYDVENIEGFDVEKIDNQILNNYSDYLADLFVQIYQFGENYRILISNSKKYSDKMIMNFKDTYISILSKIINAELSSDLSDTLK